MKNHLMHKSPRTLQICWVLLTLFICSTLQSQDLNPVYKKIPLGDQVVIENLSKTWKKRKVCPCS